ARDIVHCDLKPDNAFLISDREVDGGERIKILDFGLAKILKPAGSHGGLQESHLSGSYAALGGIIGTPGYMAPEQCRGDAKISAKADLYALVVMLCELWTGELPFSGSPPEDVLLKPQEQAPPAVLQLRADTPRPLAAILETLLAKTPEQRPSMEELAHRIG